MVNLDQLEKHGLEVGQTQNDLLKSLIDRRTAIAIKIHQVNEKLSRLIQEANKFLHPNGRSAF